MIVLGYIGNNKGDSLIVRAARSITRWVQKGAYFEEVTHVESLLGGDRRNARIGSSSLRDKGVRIKTGVVLNPANWVVLDVPAFTEEASEAWHAKNNGKFYDLSGAISTVLWLLKQEPEEYMCVEAVGTPQRIVDAHKLTTAEFMAVCLSLPGSRIVTQEFFTKELI